MTQADIILRIFLAIFGSLFYLDQLATCAYRLDLWVMAWWTGVVSAIVVMAWDSLRYKIGYKRGVLIMVLAVLFNIGGIVIFGYSYYHTPQCIPARIDTPLLIFFGGTAFGVVTCIIMFFYFGRPTIASFFIDEAVLKQTLEDIKEGKISLDDHLTNKPDVDSCCLFEFERAMIHEIGQVEGLTTHQTKPLCGICGEDLIKEDKKMTAFPVCTHVLHSECMDSWFEKYVECPFCNIGARSSLYKSIAPQLEKKAKEIKQDKKEKKNK